MGGTGCSSGWSATQQTTQEGSVAAHSRPHHSALRGGFLLTWSFWAVTAGAGTPLQGWAGTLPSPACSCPQLPGRPGWGPGVSPHSEGSKGAGPAPGGHGHHRQPLLEVPVPSFESLSTEAQSGQSSRLHFSSFSSEITKAAAAGRAGHVDGVCSAWPEHFPLGPDACSHLIPISILGFLLGPAVTTFAAGATVWAMSSFFIFIILPPQLSQLFSGELSGRFPCLSQKSVGFVTVRKISPSPEKLWHLLRAYSSPGTSCSCWPHHSHGIDEFLSVPATVPQAAMDALLRIPENSPGPQSHASGLANCPCFFQPSEIIIFFPILSFTLLKLTASKISAYWWR